MVKIALLLISSRLRNDPTPSAKPAARRKGKAIDDKQSAAPEARLTNGLHTHAKETNDKPRDKVKSDHNIETDQADLSLRSLSNGDISLSDPRLQLDPYEFPRNTTAGILAAWREVCRRKQEIQRESQFAAISKENPNALTFPRLANGLDNARQKYWEPVMDYVEPIRSPKPELAQSKSPKHQEYALQRHRSIPSMHNGTTSYERSKSLSRKQSKGNLSMTSSRGRRAKKEYTHVDGKDVRKRKRADSILEPAPASARSRSASPIKQLPPPEPSAPVSPIRDLAPSAPSTQLVPSPFSRQHRSRMSTSNALLPISITPERRRRAGFFSARDEDLDSLPETAKSNSQEGLEQVLKKARGPDGSALTPIKRSQSYSAFKTRVAPLTESPAVLALRAQREAERMAALKTQSERQERVKEITESNARNFASSAESNPNINAPVGPQTVVTTTSYFVKYANKLQSTQSTSAFGGFKFPTNRIEDNTVKAFDIPSAAQPSSSIPKFDLTKPNMPQNSTDEASKVPTYTFPTAPRSEENEAPEKGPAKFTFGTQPQNSEPKVDENKGFSFSNPAEVVKSAAQNFGGSNAAPVVSHPNGSPSTETNSNEASSIPESKPSISPIVPFDAKSAVSSTASKADTVPKFAFGDRSDSNGTTEGLKGSALSLAPPSGSSGFSFTAPTLATNGFTKSAGGAGLAPSIFGQAKDVYTATAPTSSSTALDDTKKAAPTFSFGKPAEPSTSANSSAITSSFGVAKQEGATTSSQPFGQSDTKPATFSFGSNGATPAPSSSPSSSAPAFSFNNTSNTASFGGFGGNKLESNLFGATNAPPQNDFKFGTNSSAQQTSEQSKFTFGAPTQQSPFVSTAAATAPSVSPAPFQFGAPISSTAASAPFQFGSPGPASPSSTTSFNFTAASPTPMDPSVSNPFATGAATSQASPTVVGRKLAVPRSRKPSLRR